jgi:hypothetical protein
MLGRTIFLTEILEQKKNTVKTYLSKKNAVFIDNIHLGLSIGPPFKM